MRILEMLREAAAGLYASLKRFPVAIGLAAAAAILLMILNHNSGVLAHATQTLITRIIMILLLGVPVSLGLKLAFERRPETSSAMKMGSCLAAIGLLAIYFFFLLKEFDMVSVTRYAGMTLGFYLFFLVVPYYEGRKGIEAYTIRLLSRLFITVIYAVVLFLGMAAILFTIDKLLGIRIESRFYFDLWLGVAGFFSPCFFLAGVPLYGEAVETASYPKLLKVLLLYIVMPITAVYTVILYLYFAKILITLQWPMGLVAHLVLWYSVLVVLLMFLISPLREENRWARSFIFLMSKLTLPLLLMLFVSVGIRVRAYGITENRYYVIVLALWAVGTMIYYNVKRERKNTLLLISLAFITFLSVLGPWSSYSIAVYSQNQRLEGILEKNNMLQDAVIIPAEQELSDRDKREISNILYYFSQNHSFKEVLYLPDSFKLSQMKEIFGFDQIQGPIENEERNYFYYNTALTNKPIDIRGYSYFIAANGSNSLIMGSDRDFEVRYDASMQLARVFYKGQEIYKKSLKEYGKALYAKFGVDNKYDLEPEDMTFTDENEKIKIKLIFNHMDGYRSVSEEITVTSMDFYLLVDLK